MTQRANRMMTSPRQMARRSIHACALVCQSAPSAAVTQANSANSQRQRYTAGRRTRGRAIRYTECAHRASATDNQIHPRNAMNGAYQPGAAGPENASSPRGNTRHAPAIPPSIHSVEPVASRAASIADSSTRTSHGTQTRNVHSALGALPAKQQEMACTEPRTTHAAKPGAMRYQRVENTTQAASNHMEPKTHVRASCISTSVHP